MGTYEAFEIYTQFIKTSKNNSANTARNYEGRIKEFFDIVFNKDISKVTGQELRKLMPNDVTTYINILIAKGNSKNTVITKLRSVRSFFKELSINRVVKYDLDMFKARFDSDEKHYDSLYSLEEVRGLYDFALGRKNYPQEQYLFIKSLFVTANRKSAMMELKWSDITKKFDYPTGKSVWVIEVLDKGNKVVEKAIADEFYEELLQLKQGEKVFPNMTDDIIRGTMESFTKALNDGRNITVHGIKASALTIAYKLTKDIMKVKQLGSHKDISTTQIYIREDDSYTEQLSYKLNGGNINTEKIRELSHEALLDLIMNNEDLKYAVTLKL